MKRNIFAFFRTFVFAAFVPVLSLSLVACDPDGDDDGGATVPSGVTPEVSAPDGYVNYFVEDLSFSRLAGETKVPFLINVAWSMEVVAPEGASSSWLSVEPASGDAGLHKVVVRVTKNNLPEVRTAKIQLMFGEAKVAEILVTQEKGCAYEAVDLGLSVKWASCNVGASVPEDYGDYYAWGETEEKSDYTWENYKYCNSSTGDFDYIGSNISGTSYDVAHVKWGGSWRMPTLDEIRELCDKCSWEWTTVNGVRGGQKVTGPNGNSIFLPAAGSGYGTEVYFRDLDGYYWSGTLNEDGGNLAYHLRFDEYDRKWVDYSRSSAHPVRPVTD